MKNLRLFAFAALLIGANSCQSVVEDLNTDPNNFTEISTSLLVNHTVLNLASIAEAETARNSGMWTDQFTGSDRQYITIDNYGVDNTDFDAIWGDLYRGGLSQAEIAIQQATKEGANAFLGIAQICKGYYAAEAALMFGDVPFSQAGDAAQFPDPVYDGQRDVMNAALGLISAGAGNTGTLGASQGNQVLSSTSSWGQFAKALEARYKLALRDYGGALQAARDAGFDAASNSVDIIHTTDNFAENLFFQFEAEQRTDYLTFDGSYLLDVLSDTTDVTRTDAKTNDANRRAYLSYFAEFDRLNTNPGGYFAADQNFPVIGLPEVQLILAECAAREDGVTQEAVDALNAARNYWDGLMGTDDYQDYVVGDFADADALIKAVLLEKFVSVFGLPTMYDVIRTNNLVGTYLDGRDAVIQRFLYPAAEEASNSNYPGIIDWAVPTPINN